MKIIQFKAHIWFPGTFKKQCADTQCHYIPISKSMSLLIGYLIFDGNKSFNINHIGGVVCLEYISTCQFSQVINGTGK